MLETFVNETSGEWTGSSLYHELYVYPIETVWWRGFFLGQNNIKPYTSSVSDQRGDFLPIFLLEYDLGVFTKYSIMGTHDYVTLHLHQD